MTVPSSWSFRVPRRLAVLPFVLAAVREPALAGNVLRVGPSRPFATIQAAVDAASDGDVVLVDGPGTYAGFAVAEKDLAILGDGSGTPLVLGEIDVDGLAAGKLVLLSNLSSRAASITDQAMRIRRNAGAVRVQGCTLRGWGEVGALGDGGTGATFAFDDDVVLTQCDIRGGNGVVPDGLGFTTNGGVGLFARASALGLYGSSVSGGNGSWVVFVDDGTDGGNGGHGLETPEGVLLASGCTFQGGRGGDGDYEDNPFGDGGNGGAGGHGILVGSRIPSSEFPVVQVLSCLAQGGAGGLPGGANGGYPGSPGAPGFPIQVNNGSAVALTGESRSMQGPALARETTSLTLTFRGTRDDVVVLDVQRGSLGSPRTRGPARRIGPVARTMEVGTIPTGGVLVASIPVPELGPGVLSRTVLMTPVFVDPNGIEHAGNSFAVVLVDASI